MLCRFHNGPNLTPNILDWQILKISELGLEPVRFGPVQLTFMENAGPSFHRWMIKGGPAEKKPRFQVLEKSWNPGILENLQGNNCKPLPILARHLNLLWPKITTPSTPIQSLRRSWDISCNFNALSLGRSRVATWPAVQFLQDTCGHSWGYRPSILWNVHRKLCRKDHKKQRNITHFLKLVKLVPCGSEWSANLWHEWRAISCSTGDTLRCTTNWRFPGGNCVFTKTCFGKLSTLIRYLLFSQSRHDHHVMNTYHVIYSLFIVHDSS